MADGGESGRFAVLTEAQKVDVLANKSPKNTNISTKYAISVFQEYCQSRHWYANAYNLHTLHEETMDSLLESFYCLFVSFNLFLKLQFQIGFLISWNISVQLFCVYQNPGLQCNKHNSYWYGGQYQDIQTALGSWYGLVEMILASPPAQAISFPLVRTTTLGESIYPDIALHISNYYINITHTLYVVVVIVW